MEVTEQQDLSAVSKRGGRPRRDPTVIVSVRLSVEAYDAYCRCALASRQHVRTVLRHILTLHAPSSRPRRKVSRTTTTIR